MKSRFLKTFFLLLLPVSNHNRVFCHYSACWVYLCFHNLLNCDMDYRIFNVHMWSSCICTLDLSFIVSSKGLFVGYVVCTEFWLWGNCPQVSTQSLAWNESSSHVVTTLDHAQPHLWGHMLSLCTTDFSLTLSSFYKIILVYVYTLHWSVPLFFLNIIRTVLHQAILCRGISQRLLYKSSACVERSFLLLLHGHNVRVFL